MFKKVIAAIASSAMLLSCAGMTALAAESPTISETTVSSEATRGTKYVYSDIWTTVYSKSSGTVNISIQDQTGRYYDIQMLDANGNQVWYQYHTISPNGTGSYYLGSNVRTVKLRVSDGMGTGTVNVY